jgi:RNA polymerase sigma-70 factor (ECF subfamily)
MTLAMTREAHDQDDLLSAAQSGDPGALEALLARHRNGVYRYGLQVCRTTEDAEDAVQETLWAATRAIRTFRGAATSIAGWLFTIVRHECYRLLEKGRRNPVGHPDLEQLAEESPAPAPDDELAAHQLRSQLAAGLAGLEPGQREVILLRDVHGMTAPEAAAELGLSIEALKSRLHRARVNLRDRISHLRG